VSDAPQRAQVAGESCLRFAAHVKFRYDELRKAWVVLAPERLLLPDEPAVEILKLIDGATSVDRVIDDLAKRFDVPRPAMAADVTTMLQDLVDKGVLTR
jgi:pyrroloquinoline quinone biosynthesis protein D